MRTHFRRASAQPTIDVSGVFEARIAPPPSAPRDYELRRALKIGGGRISRSERMRSKGRWYRRPLVHGVYVLDGRSIRVRWQGEETVWDGVFTSDSMLLLQDAVQIRAAGWIATSAGA